MEVRFNFLSIFMTSSSIVAGVLFLGLFSYTGAAALKYTFIRDGAEAPAESHYDYIVIGGGAAGCPLAATLSENSKVLVLERGGSPYGNHNITYMSNFRNNLCDSSPASPAQNFISGDGLTITRAQVLGGGTSINGGCYSRASHDQVVKAGWDMTLVNQSYNWVEKLLIEEPVLLQWQSAVRDGLVEAGVTPYNGFTYNHIYGTKLGGTTFDRNGLRHTAADLLAQANPEDITVFLHATVQRILFEHKGKKPVACGVIFKDTRGAEHKAYLNEGSKNEIILSAGAIGSPQLLMLSGIGPEDHLQSLGIEVVIDQPMTGQGMSDSPRNVFFVPSPSPVEISPVQPVGITHFGSYIESVSGIGYYVCPTEGSQSRSSRMEPPKVSPMQIPRKAAEAKNSLENSAFRGGFIAQKLAYPLSVGQLKLVNKDPNTNPSVTFNYFSKRKDLRVCAKGLKTIARTIKSKAFYNFQYSNMSTDYLLNLTANYLGVVPSSRNVNYSESLEQYCKDTVRSVSHYHGGCQVGQVVDSDYTVLGIDGLRVIDASTFNVAPGTNPQATVMMLGRYMGVKIQKERMGI